MTESVDVGHGPESRRAEMLLGLANDLGLSVDGLDPKTVLFELHGPDGHQWTVTLGGHCTGFPEGTRVANYAWPLALALVGKMDLKGVALTDQ